MTSWSSVWSWLAGAAVGGVLVGAALVTQIVQEATAAPPTDLPALSSVQEASSVKVDGVRITALRTGWVRVKGPHQEYRGLDALRVPAIILSGRWGPWMPVISYVIEHPERTLLVDTGVPADINTPEAFACDPGNEWFYRRNLQFHTSESETLAARLTHVGIDPASIDQVLITHFHGDHVGGLVDVPQAKVVTGPGHFPDHVGALTCRIPVEQHPTELTWTADPAGTFTGVHALTQDGRVHAIQLDGHTPGHAGIRVQLGQRSYVIVGDATFDRSQSERGAVTGASQNMRRARETQGVLKRQWAQPDVIVLPAHDPTVFERLGEERS